MKIMKHKKKIIILTAVTIVLIVGFGIYKKVNSSKKALENKKTYAIATKGTIDKKIVVAGKVKLTNEQKLRFNVSGRVTKVNFSVGDTVEQGEVIAELDKADLANNIRRDEIGLESAIDKLGKVKDKDENLEIKKNKNALDRAKSELKITKKELEELKIKQSLETKQNETAYQKKLSEIADLERKKIEEASDAEKVKQLNAELEIAKKEANNLLAQKPLDEFQKKLELQRKQSNIKDMKKGVKEQKDTLAEAKKKNVYEEELRDANNAVELQQIALRQSKTELNKYELIAPFKGILTKIDFKVGDNLVADEQKFASLKNPEILTVVTSLDQTEVVQAAIGQKAKITFSAIPGKVFEGEVVELEESPREVESEAISYEAIIKINKQGEKLYSGMTAKVEIAVAKKENVLNVPILAVRDGENAGDKFVLLKKGENEEERVPVEVGLSDNNNVEIVSGLKEGDEVLEADFEQMEANFKQTTSSSNNPEPVVF